MFERFVDYIIFFSFPSSFYLYNIPTALFSCSPTALKIANFTQYVHKLMKRGVLREEFLQKNIFSKSSHHFEHFYILRFFHISYSLEVMNKYRLLSKPVFQLKIALKIYFRVREWTVRYAEQVIIFKTG